MCNTVDFDRYLTTPPEERHTPSDVEQKIAEDLTSAGVPVAIWTAGVPGAIWTEEDAPVIVVNPESEDAYINIFPEKDYFVLVGESIHRLVPASTVVETIQQHLAIQVTDWVKLDSPGLGEAWREGHVTRIAENGGLVIHYGYRHTAPMWRLGRGEWNLPVPQSIVIEVWRYRTPNGTWVRIR